MFNFSNLYGLRRDINIDHEIALFILAQGWEQLFAATEQKKFIMGFNCIIQSLLRHEGIL